MYIWQGSNWPEFVVDLNVLFDQLDKIALMQRKLLGQVNQLDHAVDMEAQMDALIQNAIRTSAIEGEKLDFASVRSSVARQLGIEQFGLTKANKQTDALVSMLLTALTNYAQPLDLQTLFQWHGKLFIAPPLLKNINISELRGKETMQVISHRGGREVVHFEAPTRDGLESELDTFLVWFNQNNEFSTDLTASQNTIIKAAISHLWFLTLHPFDDGNGRLARAITDRALAQAENTAVRFYSMSATIEMHRSEYYNMLENSQKSETQSQRESNNPMNITSWVNWFLTILYQSLEQGQLRIKRVLAKTHFWHKNSQTVLSERQIKVLNRLLDTAGEEFVEGISAAKYQSIAQVSKATATRDLADLLKKQCVRKTQGGGRNTRYLVTSATLF